MYKRERDTTKFSDLGVNEYEDFEEFMSTPISEGLNTIRFGGRVFDFFYEDRGAPVTLVTFTAAVSPSFTKYPLFSSRPIARRLNTNYLAFSDPASGGDESLTTFWHLGTHEVPSGKVVPDIIRKVLAERVGEHLIFFGSSAGGFAALNYSAQFPGSAALVMNPRVSLLNAPKHASKFVPVAFPGVPRGDALKALPYNQATVYSEPQGNFVVYLQNMQDDNYRRHHYAHFVKAVGGRDDVHFVTENWGVGHIVPPLKTYEALLSDLAGVAPNWGEIVPAKPVVPVITDHRAELLSAAGSFERIGRTLRTADDYEILREAIADAESAIASLRAL